jgi:hypothetical protein
LFDLMAARVENEHMNATTNISIRSAYPDDYTALWRLAALDDKVLPRGPFLVAEVDGEVVAAASVATGTTVADPFRRTAEAVALLELRASQFELAA